MVDLEQVNVSWEFINNDLFKLRRFSLLKKQRKVNSRSIETVTFFKVKRFNIYNTFFPNPRRDAEAATEVLC